MIHTSYQYHIIPYQFNHTLSVSYLTQSIAYHTLSVISYHKFLEPPNLLWKLINQVSYNIKCLISDITSYQFHTIPYHSLTIPYQFCHIVSVSKNSFNQSISNHTLPVLPYFISLTSYFISDKLSQIPRVFPCVLYTHPCVFPIIHFLFSPSPKPNIR